MADASESTDAELVGRAREGDRDAFGVLVRRHQRRLYAVAVQMLGHPGEAEDAVQEALLRAYRAIDRFDARSELSTWLYRICVNVCLNALRKRRRRETADLEDPRIPEPAADPEQGRSHPGRSVELRRLHQRLSSALESLSPSLRATVVLVLLEGVSHKEAAEVLGCPEGTIAWRIHEARRRLRSELGELLTGETSAAPAAAGGRTS
jgi:RNA polymerase sigma-70 factor (ECF subfamily)